MIDSKNRLYLNFSSQRLTDSRDESSLDLQKMIPLNNPYLTFVETYRTKEAKIVVEILLSIYKDMYIYIDDIDWCGKATDFINTGFGF